MAEATGTAKASAMFSKDRTSKDWASKDRTGEK
jgi:hypothetical protein